MKTKVILSQQMASAIIAAGQEEGVEFYSNKHFLKTAKAEMEMLDKFLQKYKISAENTYNNLIPERKNLVTPYILTDDLIVKEWQSKTFKPNPYKPEHKIHEHTRRQTGCSECRGR